MIQYLQIMTLPAKVSYQMCLVEDCNDLSVKYMVFRASGKIAGRQASQQPRKVYAYWNWVYAEDSSVSEAIESSCSEGRSDC